MLAFLFLKISTIPFHPIGFHYKNTTFSVNFFLPTYSINNSHHPYTSSPSQTQEKVTSCSLPTAPKIICVDTHTTLHRILSGRCLLICLLFLLNQYSPNIFDNTHLSVTSFNHVPQIYVYVLIYQLCRGATISILYVHIKHKNRNFKR